MSHLQFHYDHTVRSLLIDRVCELQPVQIERVILSTSSHLFLTDYEEVLFRSLMLQLITGTPSIWTRVRHPVSEFGTKRGRVIGVKGAFSFPWNFIDFFIFHILSNCKTLRSSNVALSTSSLFYPSTCPSFGSVLHLIY